MTDPIPAEIPELVKRGALFVVNHSGGKDSQAMFHYIRRYVPDAQIIVVYADLGEVVWADALEHIKATTLGLPILVCKARRTLLQMVEERGMFPSPQQRQCTSDLKRGPIERTIRQTGRKLIVNCMGLRAQESSSRAKVNPFAFSTRNSKAGREWYDWLPIHHLLVEEVFQIIADAGQEAHRIYKTGMRRFSCCFCIYASDEDHTIAAGLNPPLYRTYVGLERKTGQVMMMPSKAKGRRTLEDITGIRVDAETA